MTQLVFRENFPKNTPLDIHNVTEQFSFGKKIQVGPLVPVCGARVNSHRWPRGRRRGPYWKIRSHTEARLEFRAQLSRIIEFLRLHLNSLHQKLLDPISCRRVNLLPPRRWLSPGDVNLQLPRFRFRPCAGEISANFSASLHAPLSIILRLRLENGGVSI